MAAVPSDLASIDAGWMADALRRAGYDAPHITSLRYEPMPGIAGAMGELGILTMEYAGETDLPQRMVGKRPADTDQARLYDSILHYYERESGFYRDVADTVPLPTPRCWLNLVEGDRRLLLMDHVEGDIGDLLAGCSFDRLVELARGLGRLHGRYWLDEGLRTLEWLPDWSMPAFGLGGGLTARSWEAVRARLPGAVPTDLAGTLERTWLTDLGAWTRRLAQRPWTFVHGDFQLDNVIFGPHDPVILDWQGCMRSFPGFDLGLLLVSCACEESIAREDEVIDHYRDELRTAGGPAWSGEDVVEDLAWSMPWFVAGLTVPMTQDQQDERSPRRFRALWDRSVAAAGRWQTAARLQEATRRSV